MKMYGVYVTVDIFLYKKKREFSAHPQSRIQPARNNRTAVLDIADRMMRITGLLYSTVTFVVDHVAVLAGVPRDQRYL